MDCTILLRAVIYFHKFSKGVVHPSSYNQSYVGG